ncbi:hypothetical protein CTRI78_v001601 [Colletotrichum trifolii]|uniref:Negative acting factor n=1 Tax=Colletotrichum trifolii TaxID=5466 RepID=A0A4R8RPA1_COLTR|nr:hypothetical protein CTRI78_v001601 [Colletotrichum trifolii]
MAQEDSPSISNSASTSACTESVSAPAPAPAPAPAAAEPAVQTGGGSAAVGGAAALATVQPPNTASTPTPTPTPASVPALAQGPAPAPAPAPASTVALTPTTIATPLPLPVTAPTLEANDTTAATSTSSTNSVPPPTTSTSPPLAPSFSAAATSTLPSPPNPVASLETPSTVTANANTSTASVTTATPAIPAPVTVNTTVNTTATATATPPASAPQQNGDATASSPAMSNNQQPHGLQRSYPSPSSFPSPATSQPPPQYAYHPQQSQAPNDPYRANPNAGVPSLPSMRSFEQHYPQPAPQPQVQMQMPSNQHVAYYLPPGMANAYIPQDLRYPLPHGDHHRLMRPPGGPKKCDEAHPTCNNCKKSKRECLGYDPIFKQQPGPSAIQPAPNAQRVPTPTVPSVPSSIPSSVPTLPSTPAAQVPVPVASSNPYGNQPAILPSTYNPPVTAAHSSLDPALTPAAPAVKTEATYDYAAAIDPALQGLPASASISSIQNQPFAADPRAGFDNHLRANKMKVDELIGLLGPAATTQEIALTPELLNEIINLYREVYVPALQLFFETNWFSAKDAQGRYAIEHNQAILGQFASFLRVVQSVPANDHNQMALSGVLETRLIWALACMPCSSASGAANTNARTLPSPEDFTEAANRVKVLEALICGEYLISNPLAPPVPDPHPHRQQEFEFWYNMAEFLRYHDAAKRDEMLSRLRLQLGGRENRDLMYSIAISREISPRVEPGFEKDIPEHLDESDPKNRLYVANKFIQDEAQVTGGTTNVVRRLSEIAIRSYISPGVNVTRS